MLKAIFCISAAVLLFASLILYPEFISAQIAPTNSATVSGSVTDSTGKPVAGAQVSLNGQKHATTQTDTQGLFVFIGVPFGQYQLSAAVSQLGTATRSLSVQGDTNVAIQYEPISVNGLKTIANVSTSANAQFNVTPASITQVNPIANAFQGKTSWRTILEQIPGVAEAGAANGAGFYSALPDGPLVPVQLSINGALPYETATLLDDMPLIAGSITTGLTGTTAGEGTDLGLYPLNGFGSADVVRGPGAAAPSIVDSIGGSFVLHAPGIVNQNHYAFSVSTDPYGGIVVNALAAVRWKKLSVVATYGINDSPGPTNGATIPTQIFGNPTTINGLAFQCVSSCSSTSLYNPNYAIAEHPVYGVQTGLLVCCYQSSTAWSQYSGSLALNYKLSSAVSVDVSYAGQTSRQAQPAEELTTNFVPPAGYVGSVPAGLQLTQYDGVYLAPDNIQQTSSLLEEKITASIGNGVLRLAALQNRVFSTDVISPPTQGTFQLFGGGCIASVTTSGGCPTGYSPIVFNGGTYNVTSFSCIFSYKEIQSSNNRDLLLEYTTPLGENLHAGVSFVKSYYNVPASTDCMYFGFPSNFATPSADSQTTNEMRFFVGGNLSEKTSLDLSMYFVNADYHISDPNLSTCAPYCPASTNYVYTDSNYTYAAPRLGFVWRPTAAIAVRAAAGGGFAEAPLSGLLGSNTPFCFGTTCSLTLPNLNLQPEKSFGFDLGTDIKLPRNTVLSFDVYHTNLYGQLYHSTTSSGSCPSCGGLPLYVTQYGNLGESRYEGILVNVRHTVPHGTYWSLSGGLTRGYVVSVPAGFYNGTTSFPYTPCTNCTNLSVVPGVNFNGTFTGVSVPYAQALGTLGYRWNADKYLDLVGTYYGNNNTYFRPAFVELDGHLSYPLSKNASLLVTFRNITGIYDGATQVYALTNFIGAPTVSGLPYPEYGEEYGPRTVLLTTQVRL